MRPCGGSGPRDRRSGPAPSEQNHQPPRLRPTSHGLSRERGGKGGARTCNHVIMFAYWLEMCDCCFVRYKEAAMSPANPTAKTYAALNRAFAFFNDRLFGGELPGCLAAGPSPGGRICADRHQGRAHHCATGSRPMRACETASSPRTCRPRRSAWSVGCLLHTRRRGASRHVASGSPRSRHVANRQRP